MTLSKNSLLTVMLIWSKKMLKSTINICSSMLEWLFSRDSHRWRKKFNNCTVERPVRYFSGGEFIHTDENLYLNKYVFLAAFGSYGSEMYVPKIVFGKNVHVNFNCQITAIHEIIIGDGVLIGSNVTITDHLHGDAQRLDIAPPKQRKLNSKGGVTIGKNTLIGNGAVILPGVVLGVGCIVGANSVVTRSFPDHTVIAGNPAIAIRTLVEE